MTMKLIYKRDQIKSVLSRWRDQYPNNAYRFANETAGDIRRALEALDLHKCTSSDVDQAIGVAGWADNCCDECDVDCETLVRIGDKPDYEARWQDLCLTCLGKAVKLLRREKIT